MATRKSLDEQVCGDVDSSSKETNLVMTNPKANIESVLKMMEKKNILSVPVTDVEDSTKVVSVINVVDLLTRIVFDEAFNKMDEKEQMTEDQLDVIAQKGKHDMSKLKIEDASGLSLESKTIWVLENHEPLSKMLNLFCSGVHRVLVTQPKFTDDPPLGKKLGYISQSDLVRHIMRAPMDQTVEKVMGKPVSEVAKSKVFFVRVGTPALTCFRRMVLENELSALPIIDDKGVLIDTVSLSDIRKLRSESIKDLLLPVEKYLAKSRPGLKRVNQICKPSEHVGAVIPRILLTGLHRAWVVDEGGKPVGCLSLTDTIKAIYIA